MIVGQSGGNQRLSDMNEENNTDRKWSPDPATMFTADLAYCQRRRRGFISAPNWFISNRRQRNWPSLGAVLAACVLATCVASAGTQEVDLHHDVQDFLESSQEAPADPHHDVQDSLDSTRESKQLVVRPSQPGSGQLGGPPRRLHLPGNGNDNLKSKLQNGPLTLHNGRLRPVATIERVDKDKTTPKLGFFVWR